MPTYGFGTTLPVGYEEALPLVRAALAREGFGIVSEIDLAGTLLEKLGVAIPPYFLLGVCNPSLARQALEADPDIGLLLPCNVVVREEAPGRVVVGFLDPQIMVQLTNRPEVLAVAEQAEQRLRRACAKLGEPNR